MAAQKGIKALEDELEDLIKKASGVKESDQEDHDDPEEEVDTSNREVVELDEDTFVKKAPSKKKEATPEDEPNKEEESWKKRYGDLRRHSQKQKESLEARIAELEKAKTPVNGANTPPTNPEDVKAWVEKFPQVAAIIQALAEDKAKTLYGEDIQSLKRDTEREKRSKEIAKIYKSHPDFDEIKEDDNFHDWAENQPEFIQDFVYKGSSDQVIWAVSKYKESLEKTPDPSKEAAKAVGKGGRSAPTSGDGKRRFLESEVDDMSADEYSELEEEISKAIREGRFVYDISGAAR